MCNKAVLCCRLHLSSRAALAAWILHRSLRPSPGFHANVLGGQRGEDALFFYFKILSEERTPRTQELHDLRKNPGQAEVDPCQHGTDRREFLFFWEVQDILRPRALSPAHPDPLEASRTERPERLSSFRLTFSLLSVSHLEKDRAAPTASPTVGYGRSPIQDLSPVFKLGLDLSPLDWAGWKRQILRQDAEELEDESLCLPPHLLLPSSSHQNPAEPQGMDKGEGDRFPAGDGLEISAAGSENRRLQGSLMQSPCGQEWSPKPSSWSQIRRAGKFITRSDSHEVLLHTGLKSATSSSGLAWGGVGVCAHDICSGTSN